MLGTDCCALAGYLYDSGVQVGDVGRTKSDAVASSTRVLECSQFVGVVTS